MQGKRKGDIVYVFSPVRYARNSNCSMFLDLSRFSDLSSMVWYASFIKHKVGCYNNLLFSNDYSHH